MDKIRRIAFGTLVAAALGIIGIPVAPLALANANLGLKTALDHRAGTQPFVDALIAFDAAVDNRWRALATAMPSARRSTRPTGARARAGHAFSRHAARSTPPSAA